jgi:hypothetical protein
MGMSGMARGGLAGIVLRWASRLRFPYLFLLTAALFVANLFVPDALPMADELLMGLLTLLLASIRKRRPDNGNSSPSPEPPRE